jgi:hypothetical protein
MNIQRSRNGGERGGGAQVIIILLALVALAVVFFITRKPGPPETKPQEMAVRTAEEPAPVATVAPTPPPKATPTPTPPPEIVKAPPTPPPVVEAKPPSAPAPPPLDLATVAVSPTLWPPKVALLQPYSFPIVLNGSVVGQAKAPVGTLVRLVRINGQQVEIEFQNVRHVIPAAATDLMQRALLKLQSGDSAQPMTPMTPPTSTAATQAPKTTTEVDGVKFGQYLAIEPVAKLSTVRSGGYFDKRDEFELKLKFKNSHTRSAAENLKGEVYILGESLKDPNVMRILGSEDFTFSLPPQGSHEAKTKEVKTEYYNSGTYRSGVKYWGWFLRIRDNGGNLVKVKSSSATLEKNADKMSGLKVDTYYDKKTLKETTANP